MNQPAWKLRLLGEFELLAPSGEPVNLAHRKVRGLLAMLAMAGPTGESRSSLQHNLWPATAIDSQQNNLRQTISLLKRAIGQDALVTTRDRCRLAVSFRLECDATDLKSAKPALPFMPEHDEPWFTAMRATRDDASGGVQMPTAAQPLGPIESFTTILEWTSQVSPKQSLELLKNNLDLASGLFPARLVPVVERALGSVPANHPLRGWAMYWKGALSIGTDLEASRIWMYRAIELARSSSDALLEAEAVYLLGAAEIITDRTSSAERLVERAEGLGAKQASRSMLARATDLSAHVHLHRGQTREGLRILRVAGDLYDDDTIRTAQTIALRALYSAVDGTLDEANQLLQVPEQMFPRGDHLNLSLVCSLTRGLIAMKAEELDRAVSLLKGAVDVAVKTNSLHFEIYARDALAGAAWRLREKSEAARQLRISNRRRRSLKMGVTAWDRQRLAGMPVS